MFNCICVVFMLFLFIHLYILLFLYKNVWHEKQNKRSWDITEFIRFNAALLNILPFSSWLLNSHVANFWMTATRFRGNRRLAPFHWLCTHSRFLPTNDPPTQINAPNEAFYQTSTCKRCHPSTSSLSPPHPLCYASICHHLCQRTAEGSAPRGCSQDEIWAASCTKPSV